MDTFGDRDDLELGAELDADVALVRLVRSRRPRCRASTRSSRPRAEPDVGEKADLDRSCARSARGSSPSRSPMRNRPSPPMPKPSRPTPAISCAAAGDVHAVRCGRRPRCRRSRSGSRSSAADCSRPTPRRRSRPAPRTRRSRRRSLSTAPSSRYVKSTFACEHAVGAIAGALVERREVEVVDRELHAERPGIGRELVEQRRLGDGRPRSARAACRARRPTRPSRRRHLDEVVDARRRDDLGRESRRAGRCRARARAARCDTCARRAAGSADTRSRRARDDRARTRAESARRRARSSPGRDRRGRSRPRSALRRLSCSRSAWSSSSSRRMPRRVRRACAHRQVALPASRSARRATCPTCAANSAEHLGGRRIDVLLLGRRRRRIRPVDQHLGDVADVDRADRIPDDRARHHGAGIGDARRRDRDPVLDERAGHRVVQRDRALDPQRAAAA